MKRVTAAQLRELGACEDQVRTVEKHWPRGVPLTGPSINKAMSLGLDVGWFAQAVLGAPAWAEYNKVRAPAWAEYEKVMAPALAEYEKVRATALAEYNKVKAPAWAEYGKVRATALAPLLREALP